MMSDLEDLRVLLWTNCRCDYSIPTCVPRPRGFKICTKQKRIVPNFDYYDYGGVVSINWGQTSCGRLWWDEVFLEGH